MDLQFFSIENNLSDASFTFFKELNIPLKVTTSQAIPIQELFQKSHDSFRLIDNTYYLGLIDDSIFQTSNEETEQTSLADDLLKSQKHYEGLMLFALDLNTYPTRSQIAILTRLLNQISETIPVALLFRYVHEGITYISLSINERFEYLQTWRSGEKLGKAIILRDINTQDTHTGHLRILEDLQAHQANNFNEFHRHWLSVLNINVLNQNFYKELYAWYEWAMDYVHFPDTQQDKQVRNATHLIRLLTRIIFIWFIKEKRLVPKELFDRQYLSKILKQFHQKNSHDYYNAILQNLFFATLNQKTDQRAFAQEGDFNTNKKEYDIKVLYRYADLFKITKEEVIELFKNVPFLNGGLFDCLDREKDYIDGFSRNPSKKAQVPDFLFFDSSRGLFSILNRYKFTVLENTPIERRSSLRP